MTCPQCREDRARRIERRGVADQLANWFSLKPWACASCGNRFRARQEGGRGPSPLMEAEMRMQEIRRGKKWKRFQYNWLGFLIAVLLLGALMAAILGAYRGAE